MTYEQYILIKIAEEAGEVAKRALKAAQFGLMEQQTEFVEFGDNTGRLISEICDLNFYIKKLGEASPYVKAQIAINKCAEQDLFRETKYQKYISYSKSLGMVEKVVDN